MENKDAICKALAETLKLTRNHQDLDDLYYMVEDNGDEIVRVQWMNGAHRDINVSMDSGTAMIRDIMKAKEIKGIDDRTEILKYTGAGLHNSIWRGKNLGNQFTAEQSAAIRDGSFNIFLIVFSSCGLVVFHLLIL